VFAAAGQVALQRGPVVYCVEEADNGAPLAALALPRTARLEARFTPDLLGGCVVLEGSGVRTASAEALYSTATPASLPVRLRAVPYALWANRGEGEMRVWLRES
jgi:DUF1680 family protein